MRSALLTALLVLLVACKPSGPTQPVERLGGTSATDVATFTLQALRGTRDGDRLDVEAVYGATTPALSVHLQLSLTPQPRLSSGTWTGPDAQQGTVRQGSVTFLGGQNAGPSIGGSFDLLGVDGNPVYRVAIPLQELRRRL